MPLLPGRKNFNKNVATEMSAGKPKPQALAISYNVAKKNKRKKMASGGVVDESAATERRPMPEERDKDSSQVSMNSSMKAPKDDQWTSNSTVKQAQRPSQTKLSKPPLVGSDAFSVRYRDEIEQDNDRMMSEPAGSPAQEPKRSYDEEDATKQGPTTPSLKMKMMAEGGMAAHPKSRPDKGFGAIIVKKAKGGMINEEVGMQDAEDDMVEHPQGLESDDDQMRPSEDEYMSSHEQMLAEGGMAEMEEDRHDSIAAAIMAKRNQMSQDSDSDEDQMVMLAEGGDIESHDSIYSDDSDQADLSRNADEDANEEDQTSFNALRKENYSESDGLDQLDQPEDSNTHGADIDSDKHDMISQIRNKMMSKRRSR